MISWLVLIAAEKMCIILAIANKCCLHSIASERIGNSDLKAAIKFVHEHNWFRYTQ